MLAEFEDGARGAKAGESRNVTVNFPADYGSPVVAGKTAIFAVTVKAVEEEKLPVVDDAFCEAFGVTEGGVEALRREAAAGPRERFVPLLVDATDADAAAVSIVFKGDEQVGLVTSGGYGYRLKQSIALAYVRTDVAVPGTELTVEILGERRRAVVAVEPLYDPQNLRLKA